MRSNSEENAVKLMRLIDILLLRRVRDAGLRIASASSAQEDELKEYLDIALIADLIDVRLRRTMSRNRSARRTSSNSSSKSSRSRAQMPSRSATRPTTPQQRRRPRSRPSACSTAGSRRLRCDLIYGLDRQCVDRPRLSTGRFGHRLQLGLKICADDGSSSSARRLDGR